MFESVHDAAERILDIICVGSSDDGFLVRVQKLRFLWNARTSKAESFSVQIHFDIQPMVNFSLNIDEKHPVFILNRHRVQIQNELIFVIWKRFDIRYSIDGYKNF